MTTFAGVWKYARYPNYGGEMLVWWGLWLISIPVLVGGYWVCVVCGLAANLLTLGAHFMHSPLHLPKHGSGQFLKLSGF